MKILAIDPGTAESAWTLYDSATSRRINNEFEPNDHLLRRFNLAGYPFGDHPDHLAVEMVASYGMPVGREVFETCVWIGRFVEAWARDRGDRFSLVYRRDVKLHLCGTARAKDPHVRQALLDRFGPGRALAVGTKAQPGPLYGMRGHEMAALAVAVTWADTRRAVPA